MFLNSLEIGMTWEVYFCDFIAKFEGIALDSLKIWAMREIDCLQLWLAWTVESVWTHRSHGSREDYLLQRNDGIIIVILLEDIGRKLISRVLYRGFAYCLGVSDDVGILEVERLYLHFLADEGYVSLVDIASQGEVDDIEVITFDECGEGACCLNIDGLCLGLGCKCHERECDDE